MPLSMAPPELAAAAVADDGDDADKFWYATVGLFSEALAAALLYKQHTSHYHTVAHLFIRTLHLRRVTCFVSAGSDLKI